VHLYTGIGAPLALIALVASGQGWFGVAFGCMALATFIDATDGQLARRVDVKRVLPHFDGSRLDDIVDYLNYVIVPIVLAYQAGLVPPGFWGLAIASAPLIASGYGFSHEEAKTADASANYSFTGFPSYWNIVVFYLYAFGWPVWMNVAILLTFAVLVFVPIRYLYPSRSTVARMTTYVLGGIWGLIMIILLSQFPAPSRVLAVVSLYFPVYYVGLSLYLHFRPQPS
jgi:phosphatidylcholine synthase